MAINAAKQLLDELMGRERNLAPNEKKYSLDWNNSNVCKHYLVNFCPNSLFTNTKADIGPCNLVHDDYLKKEFQTKASRRERHEFEDEFIRFCQAQLNDVERKIKRAKQRLEMSQMEKNINNQNNPVFNEEALEKINDLTERIEKKLDEIQKLGCEGNVEEAQEAMKVVDQLKEERSLIKRENQSGHWIQHKAELGVAQEKQMEVCDVCGAFLIVNDVQQRVDDHLMGKQHVGYGRLKTALDEIFERRKQVAGDMFEEKSNRSDREHGRDYDRKRDNRDRDRRGERYRDRRDRNERHRRHRSRSPERSYRSRERSRSPQQRYRHGHSNGTNR